MTEQTIDRPGSSTTYTITGSGPPVVLGHSLFCQRSMWQDVIDRLSSEFTFINVGLRGHGESTATAPFSLSDLAADWVAILDQEKIDRAALCGLSTGGMTALRMGLAARERVAGLALVDTDADAEPAGWKKFQYDALGQVYRLTGFIPVGTLSKAMFCKKTRDERPELVADLVAMMKSFDRSQLRHTMKAVFGRDSVDASGIELPTLVVVGAEDEALPPSRSRKLAEAIGGARLEVIADAGHLTAVEQPEKLAELLAGFLPRCFAD